MRLSSNQGTTLPYLIVFDSSQKPFQWWWPAIGLLLIILGIVLIKYGRLLPRRILVIRGRRVLSADEDSKIIGWCFIIFGSAVTFALFSLMYADYREYARAYKAEQYSVVEGVVADFQPAYSQGSDECFRVNAQRFGYSEGKPTPGFNQTASHGGPIKPGFPVRITYLRDESLSAHILRLEVRIDAFLRPTAR
jgi:hypothetical protein